MTQIAPALGVLAALIGIANTVPYVLDTLRRSNQPHRGTWLIWSVLAIVVCLTQRADSASWSLVMAGTHVVLDTVILVLAMRLGTGGASVSEALVITVAAAGVAGWLVADQPIVATLCVIVADLIAAAMMVPKATATPAPRRSQRSRARVSVAPWRPDRSARSSRHCCCTRLLLPRQRSARAVDRVSTRRPLPRRSRWWLRQRSTDAGCCLSAEQQTPVHGFDARAREEWPRRESLSAGRTVPAAARAAVNAADLQSGWDTIQFAIAKSGRQWSR